MSATAWPVIVFDALNRCTPQQADHRRAVLPYHIRTMEGEPERAIVLNRWYLPLNTVPSTTAYKDRYERAGARIIAEFVEYEDFPPSHIHIELFKLLTPTLNASGCFFEDRSAPWHSMKNLREYRRKIIDLVSPWIDASEWE